MKFDKTEVWGFEHAIRGMRNPKESWDKSDSDFKHSMQLVVEWENDVACTNLDLGKKDIELMQTLIRAGSEHRKFMRQIFVSVDITAPLYWWKEFDTYKVGTVADSTSTMHKLTSKPITRNCFEHGEMIPDETLKYLEHLRFLATSEDRPEYFRKDAWKNLIVNLPESWLQTRTVTMNYENILNMVQQRVNHKLTEWSRDFVNWAMELPYAEELFV